MPRRVASCMQDYRRILAWQRAHALSIAVHKICRGFTRAGHASLRSQLTRAADSVPANIVEGCGTTSNKDFARYLEIAVKSANEVEYHLLKARDHELIGEPEWQRLSAEMVEIRRMIYVYRKKVLGSS